MRNTITIYEPITCRYAEVHGGIRVVELTNTLDAIIEEKGWVSVNDIADALDVPRVNYFGDVCGILQKTGYRFMVPVQRDEEGEILIGVLTYDKPPKD